MKLATFIQLSRPRFWNYLAGPFLLGYISGMSSLNLVWEPYFWLGLLFFLLPANFFLYGVNDLFDQETDALNQKKGTHEHRFDPRSTFPLLVWLVAIGLLGLGGAYFINLSVFGIMVLFLFLSWAYSAPPLRFKTRPVLDSYSNLLYILPGVLGYLIHQPELPPLWVLIAGVLWTAAMHAYSAIPDIEPDQKAGVTTIAVKLGEKRTLLFVFLNWLGFAGLLLWQVGAWGSLSLLYPLIPLLHLIVAEKLPVAKVYWFFPLLNTLLGGIAFWSLLWQKL